MPRPKVVTELAETVSSAQNVIQFAPFGIVGLLHESLSKTGVRGVMGLWTTADLAGGHHGVCLSGRLSVHGLLLTRQNPYPLTFWTLKVSGIPAFFTRSGAVNIPINPRASEDLGLNKDSYAISIPLGGFS